MCADLVTHFCENEAVLSDQSSQKIPGGVGLWVVVRGRVHRSEFMYVWFEARPLKTLEGINPRIGLVGGNFWREKFLYGKRNNRRWRRRVRCWMSQLNGRT